MQTEGLLPYLGKKAFFVYPKSLVGVVGLYFVDGQLLLVNGSPGIDDVGEDEGNKQGDVEHGAEGELAT